MNSGPNLPWKIIKSLTDDIVYGSTGQHLKDFEVDVLQGSWEAKGYEQIAEEYKRSIGHTTETGSELWKKLSIGLGEKVSKVNFKEALRREWERRSSALLPQSSLDLKMPGGPIGLDCPFYIERPPIESECYKMILQPGSLIRIRAPRRMGKTSLVNRILAYAADRHYQTARINIRQAEKSVFANLDKFLRWFSANVSRQIGRDPKLDDYWDKEIGSMVSCTLYFQMHLLEPLEQTDGNLVVSLDEIDWIFHYPEIAEEFLSLLRSWYEEANTDQKAWKRLRLVIAHATEVYIPLKVDQSPFNVGSPIKLPEFNQQQVQELARLHGIIWANGEMLERLVAMIGGHPYLVRIALYSLARLTVTLEQLLQEAPTHAGIYSEHLRHHLRYLHQQPDLAAALKQVVLVDSPVQLEWLRVYQLESMGLIKLNENKVSPSCELYRQYFCAHLS